MGAFENLLNQIDVFIRKFYKNQMLRGALLFAGIFLVSFLLLTTLEFFGRFNSTVRAIFFFGFLAVNLFVLVKYILIPISKLFSFGKRINREQAASIIGSFFPNVNDRLLNTLQLSDNLDGNVGNIELLRASVAQKSKALNVVPFASAVQYKENKKYLKYLIPILLVVLALIVFVPKLFSEGTERIVNYSAAYVEPAPFDFVFNQDNLIVEEGTDVELNLQIVPKTDGELPSKVYLRSDDGVFVMDMTTKSNATYTIDKVGKSIDFTFEANGFSSNTYSLEVKSKASISSMSANIKYPAYLKLKDKTIENSGDLIVPEGSVIEWNVTSKNADEVQVRSDDVFKVFNNSGFRFTKDYRNNAFILFGLVNKELNKVDTINYTVDVIKDNYPSILVTQITDTTNSKKLKFEGNVSDDIGLRNAVFVYEVSGKNGLKKESIPVPGIVGTKAQISMEFDISTVDLNLEDELTYYFVVYDNDGVNGSKSRKSTTYSYKVPSKQELKEQRNEDAENAKESLSSLLNRSEQFNENIQELKKDLFNSKNADWNQMQQLEQLKQQQQNLQKDIQEVKNDLNESLEEKEQLTEIDEELKAKQELIDKLLEEVMDEEMMDLLKQLEEMMKNQNQEQMNEMMDQLEMSAEDRSKQLDRTLEQLKTMQVNEQIDDIEDALNELAEKQKQLEEDIANDKLTDEKGKEEQDKLNDEFDKVKEDMKEMQDKNEELARPLDIDKFEEDQKEISEEMQNASDKLDSGKEKKASQSQKKASEKMQEMAQSMNEQQQQSQEEQAQEDREMLRNVLESLMKLSFSQEANMDNFKTTSVLDPGYKSLGREQQKIIDDKAPVADSLFALAKRQPKIARFIDKELGTIGMNYRDLVDDIDERRKKELGVKQQFVMTSYNNLALFLNESLEDMQDQMNSQKQGGGSCSKPGGKGKGQNGEQPMQGMKEMLKKQLEQMKKGKSPGGNKPGQKPGQGQGAPMPFGSKQAAQIAAQQGKMRRELQKLKEELNKEGKGKGNGLNKLLQELEEQEKDLINKNWDSGMIKRQKEIMTRLLESEKAIEERGFDDKRESKSGKNQDFGNQIKFDEYNKQKEQQIELLETLNPRLDRYYKVKANEYFNKSN